MLKKYWIAGLLTLAIFSSCVRSKKAIVAANTNNTSVRLLNNKIDSVSYSLGVSTGKSVKGYGLDSLNADLFAKGLEDVMKSDSTLIKPEQAQELLMAFFQGLYNKKLEAEAAAGKMFLEENKTKEGVKTTESGLQYKILKEGAGPSPKLSDKVKVHYHGTLVDGQVFDSSVDRGKPVDFSLTDVIPGWTEALQLMKVGSKFKLFVPPNLGYAERGMPPKIGPNAVLVFEVELLGINQ